MSKSQGPIIILDTSAIVHRFYHALPRLEAPDGTPVQALYGLANVLLRIIHEYQPRQIFACLDRPETTERERAYAEYKATRSATADDLRTQLNRVGELLTAFGIPTFEQPGYEADDLIGTLVTKIRERSPSFAKATEGKDEIAIATGDLDTLQLIEPGVTVLILRKGFSEVERYDEAAVRERFGITPAQLVDFKSLVGDQSDNITGLSGVGEKRAAALIERFGSIENIIAGAAEISEPKVRAAVEANGDRLRLNKQLTTIVRDLPVEVPTEPFLGIDPIRLIPVLRQFNFRSIIERIGGDNSNIPETATKSFALVDANTATIVKALQQRPDPIVAVIVGGSCYLRLGDRAYRTAPTPALIEQLLELKQPVLIFDIKNFFRCLWTNSRSIHFNYDLSQLIDLKLRFSLVHSNIPAVDLERFVNLSSNRTYEFGSVGTRSRHTPDEERIVDFLTLAPTVAVELEKRLQGLKLEPIEQLEHQVIPVLARMEQIGLYLNRQCLDTFKQTLEQRLGTLEREVHRVAGTTFNLASPVALRRVLFEELKLSVKGVHKTKKGALSTQEAELEKLREVHPIIPLILEHRELAKLRSTYTDTLTAAIDPVTGRLHTTFEQLGAATGRISSQAPNLQNIPIRSELALDLRRCFEAESGWRFLGLDYSQIELRLAAHLSGDEAMLAAFQAGLDIHSITAKLLFKRDDEASRRIAKVVNFGIIYGMSAPGLAERLRIPRAEAQTIIDNYFRKFPKLRQLCNDLLTAARTHGYSETIFGRKRIIPEISSSAFRERAAAERAAVNAPLQGSSADLMKRVLVNVDDYLRADGLFPDQARIVLQVYDQLVLEVKADILDSVQIRVRALMEQAVTLAVPLVVKVRSGRNLAEL